MKYFLGETSSLINSFRASFNYVFIGPSIVEVGFLKKVKSLLVKGFPLNFAKKVKCIRNIKIGSRATPLFNLYRGHATRKFFFKKKILVMCFIMKILMTKQNN